MARGGRPGDRVENGRRSLEVENGHGHDARAQLVVLGSEPRDVGHIPPPRQDAHLLPPADGQLSRPVAVLHYGGDGRLVVGQGGGTTHRVAAGKGGGWGRRRRRLT